LKLDLIAIFTAVLFALPAGAVDIPTSRRARNAINRVRPILEKTLLAQGFKYGSPIFIRVFKESSELEVWVKKKQSFELFKIYPICTFSGKLGPKQIVGDMQAPEGFYYVTPSQMNPSSQFHLSFNVGYPNPFDRAHGRTGSALMIHGNCVSIGCYAMTDPFIEEIYALADSALRNGQSFFRVHIFPFRMTNENMVKHGNSKWMGFWRNLKEGYDFFEDRKIPPNVVVKHMKYVFEST
jgi:murein L,D-transpeptidase YafK